MQFLVSLESAPGLLSPDTLDDLTRALGGTCGFDDRAITIRGQDRTLVLDAALPERDAIAATRAGVRLFAEALERAGLPPEISRARVVSLAA